MCDSSPSHPTLPSLRDNEWFHLKTDSMEDRQVADPQHICYHEKSVRYHFFGLFTSPKRFTHELQQTTFSHPLSWNSSLSPEVVSLNRKYTWSFHRCFIEKYLNHFFVIIMKKKFQRPSCQASPIYEQLFWGSEC